MMTTGQIAYQAFRSASGLPIASWADLAVEDQSLWEAAGAAVSESLDQDDPLQSLGEQIRRINKANGWRVTKPEEWGDDYKIPGVLALIHSEVSEALEAFRKDDGENFVEELADILIRVLDLAPAVTDDFDATVREKLAKNKGRGHRHGGKRI